MVGLALLYLRKKRQEAAAQPAVALTSISLTTTKERRRPPAEPPSYTDVTRHPEGGGGAPATDVVTETRSDSQAARTDGSIMVGDRVVTVNGEAPSEPSKPSKQTVAKPSSTILQATVAGTNHEFTSEARAVSAGTEMGQSSSYSAEPTALSASPTASLSASPTAPSRRAGASRRAETVPVATPARDSQKMRRAADLLESWKLEPSELAYGDKIGAGGQADVYVGCWQVRCRLTPSPYWRLPPSVAGSPSRPFL